MYDQQKNTRVVANVFSSIDDRLVRRESEEKRREEEKKQFKASAQTR
jgi:hypothetical protein